MGQLVAWVGRSAVIVSTATAKAPEKEAFLAVAGKLAAQGQGSSPKPELVSKLPADGLDAGSVIYCHYRQALDQVFYAGEENVLGLGDDVKTPTEVEAAHARYALDDRPHALIAIRYPDEAAAAKAAAAFAATLKDEARSEDSQGFWRDFGLRNGKHTIIYQSGKLLAISPEAVAVDKVKDLIRALAAAVTPPPPEPATGGG
jgi:hypothetical protein